ncbi:putative arabinose 5-phosphate isomerase [Hibiscus syriacus]|uniref:Arabinose 5-phosphate isomerase n=1 Tax=Hibiscus syriacus TaxID=106335 RepID=A0A6A3C6V9_HIBSY|nr:putative arabinose 5-phosphate isomerase [Hibiscus syriacus]
MGSLPPSLDLPSPPSEKQQISETTLLDLFKFQQNHLNYFFQNLDFRKIGIFRQQDLPNPSFLGIRSSFLSPLDALHGDIGAISSADVLVLFSKSGSTEELLCLFPSVRAKGAYLISVTSVSNNALSNACDLNMHFPLERELCPFNLAPVTSTAIQMVFGDTVAIALMGARNLTKEQYAANHPAGRIGKSLFSSSGFLMNFDKVDPSQLFVIWLVVERSKKIVKDVMKKRDELPICKEGYFIMDQLVELTSKGCGCLLVITMNITCSAHLRMEICGVLLRPVEKPYSSSLLENVQQGTESRGSGYGSHAKDGVTAFPCTISNCY